MEPVQEAGLSSQRLAVLLGARAALSEPSLP